MKTFFFIRSKDKMVRVNIADLLYIEACKNYIKLFTIHNKNFLALQSMKEMEQVLPEETFLRIHRSYIVSIKNITAFDKDSVYLDNTILPIGLNYRNTLLQCVPVIDSELRRKRILKKVA